MGESEIWAALGIAPTSDQRAIRAAYAARLKAIDPDSDPGAFVSLREAFTLARAGDAGSAAEVPMAVLDMPVPAQEVSAPPPQAPPPPAGDAESFHARIGVLAGLFEAAARSPHPWLSRDAKAVLRENWRGIAEELREADIAFYGAAERDVAYLIARWGQLAVGLVIPATEFFGWATREIDLATDDAVIEVVRRYRLVRFLQVVRKPGIAHHAAWVELTTKGYPGSGRGRCDPVLVHELLVIIREIWPEMETELDPLRVEAWRDNTAAHLEEELRDRLWWQRARILYLIFAGLFGLVAIARAIAEMARAG